MLVIKLPSRSEMLASPEALSAARKEAEGLANAGTWDLNSVREHADVRSEAKKTGVSVHFGQLMTYSIYQILRIGFTSSEDERTHRIPRRLCQG